MRMYFVRGVFVLLNVHSNDECHCGIEVVDVVQIKGEKSHALNNREDSVPR